MNVVGTPDQVYWAKQGFRNAVAKLAGVTSNAILWYRVLPNQDDFGRPFTE